MRLGLAALAGLLLIGSGCALTRRVAVGSMVPILENATASARERDDLTLIEAAFPANLLLLDGLLRTEPKNTRLLALGSYLYFGYGLGFVETESPERAREHYARGRDYGLRALDRHTAFRKGRAGSREAFIHGLSALKKNDVPAGAWAAANWARWLSLSLDSPAAIAEMPKLEALLDRMLELDPQFERGLPHALRGSYDVLRSEMFGGNPTRSRQHFEAAFACSGRRMLLYQVFYAEFYCRQLLDEACFVATLDEVEAAPADLLPEARLLNAIGKRRAAWLRARQSEMF